MKYLWIYTSTAGKMNLHCFVFRLFSIWLTTEFWKMMLQKLQKCLTAQDLFIQWASIDISMKGKLQAVLNHIVIRISVLYWGLFPCSSLTILLSDPWLIFAFMYLCPMEYVIFCSFQDIHLWSPSALKQKSIFLLFTISEFEVLQKCNED